MRYDALSEFVADTAAEVRMPGVAVGVLMDGRESYACHGVTSLENPVPIDRDTAFLLGSVTETYTTTALMCLVADGQVRLGAPARGDNPGGGIASSVADQLRWAAFHLGDGHVNGSGRVLPGRCWRRCANRR